MAITYPRDIPDVRFRAPIKFEPLYDQVRAISHGGSPQVGELGPDLWSVQYETVSMREAQASAFEAWLSSLRGGQRFFKAWHPLRQYALAYPRGYAGLMRAAGGSFDGSATLDSISVPLDAATLSGLPAGFKFSAGDFISYAHAEGRQRLHRVIEPAVASGLGIATVSVEPRLTPSPPPSAEVALVKPWCVVSLEKSSVSWAAGRRATATFSGTQVLK